MRVLNNYFDCDIEIWMLDRVSYTPGVCHGSETQYLSGKIHNVQRKSAAHLTEGHR